MTIRVRLVIMCLVVALLPAIPLTLLVQQLIDKSFSVGLSETVEDALQSGVAVSRDHFNELRDDFRRDVSVTAEALGFRVTSKDEAAERFARVSDGRGGVIDPAPGDRMRNLPRRVEPYAGSEVLQGLLAGATLVGPRHVDDANQLAFYETDTRTLQLAAWTGEGRPMLFYRQTSPEFLTRANEMIEGRQIFAQLRLTRGELARSFFYPFVIIYGVCVVLALALALFMAERLADPIRRLVLGTNKVASGDWSYRIDVDAPGETGKLVGAFNTMVDRLDDQQRRLVDTEKMASWRDVARHLAHEIKNPLLPIRLTIDELKDQYQGEDPRYRGILDESVRVVRDEVEHLQTLVKSFSEFAKLPELKPETASLDALVRDVSQLYPQVSTQTAGETPEFRFDAGLLRRVVVNLYDNVVAVTGGDARVRVELTADDTAATLRFSDDGPGIAPEHLPRVFEPYFTTRAEGSGLGLAMSKNIVLMHGGSMGVESEPGNGTTFTIALPLAGPPAGESNTD